MAHHPYPSFLAVCLGVALHPLDRFGAVHGAGSGVPVLPCSQRKAALLEHAAGGHRLRRVLDWTLLSSGYLRPQLCQVPTPSIFFAGINTFPPDCCALMAVASTSAT